MDGMLVVWGMNGKWAARRAHRGRLKAKLGRKTKVSSSGSREGNVGNEALHVIGLHGLGGKISVYSWRIGSWQRWF